MERHMSKFLLPLGLATVLAVVLGASLPADAAARGGGFHGRGGGGHAAGRSISGVHAASGLRGPARSVGTPGVAAARPMRGSAHPSNFMAGTFNPGHGAAAGLRPERGSLHRRFGRGYAVAVPYATPGLLAGFAAAPLLAEPPLEQTYGYYLGYGRAGDFGIGSESPDEAVAVCRNAVFDGARREGAVDVRVNNVYALSASASGHRFQADMTVFYPSFARDTIVSCHTADGYLVSARAD
jgi:hypothetical protein